MAAWGLERKKAPDIALAIALADLRCYRIGQTVAVATQGRCRCSAGQWRQRIGLSPAMALCRDLQQDRNGRSMPIRRDRCERDINVDGEAVSPNWMKQQLREDLRPKVTDGAPLLAPCRASKQMSVVSCGPNCAASDIL